MQMIPKTYPKIYLKDIVKFLIQRVMIKVSQTKDGHSHYEYDVK